MGQDMDHQTAKGDTNDADQIIVSNASKVIKGHAVLSNVSVNLKRGGIYGFFGLNGSGKTMLFRAIAGLVRLDSGTIRVFGEAIGENSSFPKSLGIIIEAVGFWEEYTGFRNLKLLASIKHQIDDNEICAALARVGLDPSDKRTYRKYSLGMKQRLGIAQAIMERPELLILDEPTNALDTDGLLTVLEIIKEQQQRGATVLIASHNVADLEELCERRFKMHEGSLSEEVPEIEKRLS
ncbi:MAG: ATP-binding cassette domain-containing protein [Coriobacteriales bacterium]|jgi:ABC-2 type transport system ATP-binding protein|nr:ATP-binding cassette domain-containing protein [Coriobacteriales bacterium]